MQKLRYYQLQAIRRVMKADRRLLLIVCVRQFVSTRHSSNSGGNSDWLSNNIHEI
jgi:hypothetical protein